MFRQRLWALMLAVVLLVGTLMPAQADVRQDYADAQQALEDYLMGGTDMSIVEIYNWFVSCGDYGMSYFLVLYAECLCAVEANNFSAAYSNINYLRTEREFVAYLAEHLGKFLRQGERVLICFRYREED